MHARSSAIAGLLVSLSIALPAIAQTAPATPPAAAQEPAMQVPADTQAYRDAAAITDPTEKTAALQKFLADFPKSKRVGSARTSLLKLLLDQQPQDQAAVHAVAAAMVDDAPAAGKAVAENDVAYQMAEALPNGVDLATAEAWSKDSLAKTTEAALTDSLTKGDTKPSASVVHETSVSEHSSFLQTYADILFHEGKLDEASKALGDSAALDPNDGSVMGSRGQIAHARHQDAEALEWLEKAEIAGGITPATAQLMRDIYAAGHNGDTAGLEADIDRRYAAQPKPFEPKPFTGKSNGHTVLVELYTGSACEPCVAADLALDGALETYSRADVVLLSFDQHIPEPDPLANGDTIDRGDYSDIHYTPSVRVDGQFAAVNGGDRKESKNTYAALTKTIEAELKTKSGVTLNLTAALLPDNTVSAKANVQVTDADALAKFRTAKPKEDKEAEMMAKLRGTAAPKPNIGSGESRLVVNFALVQPRVSYSGQNGVRFHSMVVRAIAKPSAEGFAVADTGSSSAEAAFDPAAISAKLDAYLKKYAKQHNAHFLSTDTAIPVKDLAVAAWVEDPKTHHIVAAAFAPLATGKEVATR